VSPHRLAQRLQLTIALGTLVAAALLVSLDNTPPETTAPALAASTREPATAAPTVRLGSSPTPIATASPPTTAPAPTSTPTPAPPQRDVYYIVIERVPNAEILAKEFGFDNAPFLDELRKRGFVLPSRVRGPYPKTPHSISSTVNMNYLSFPETSGDWHLVNDSLSHSTVAQLFQRKGYLYALIGSGYYALRRDKTADINPVYEPSEKLDERRLRYEEVRFMYRKALGITRYPDVTFTFMHIETTHPPYVFDRHGRFLTQESYDRIGEQEAYLESLRYANARSIELIDAIQASAPADRQPIIVFQADEGPGPEGWDGRTKGHFDWTSADQRTLDIKFRIFSSYYLPGLKDTGLFPNISTVNSFRLVFNKYFGARYRLLPNRSYVFPDETRPYEFIDVTDRVN
jgi:hypothetical protein